MRWRAGNLDRVVTLYYGVEECAGHRPRQVARQFTLDELERIFGRIGKILLLLGSDKYQHFGVLPLVRLQAQPIFVVARYHEQLSISPDSGRGSWVRWVVGEVGEVSEPSIGQQFHEKRRILTLWVSRGLSSPPI